MKRYLLPLWLLVLITTLLLCLRLPSLLRIARAAASAAVPARESADLCHPEPFAGEGDQDHAGAVRRFIQ